MHVFETRPVTAPNQSAFTLSAMQSARVLARLLASTLFAGTVAACAAGDMGIDFDPGAVTTQSTPTDAGVTLDSGVGTGTGSTNLPPATPASGDDAGNDNPTSSSDDAGSTGSDDAGQPVSDDSGATPPPVDSGTSSSSCPGYAAPSTKASCYCDKSKHSCTANGCYNGYYCKLSDTTCVQKPSSC
jgi:hypothetical protein